MKPNTPHAIWAMLCLCQVCLLACSTLRTEIYREETFHLYCQASKLYQQGDYASARNKFLMVVQLDPAYGPAHAALGNLALIGEDYSQALLHYQASVTADPELEADLRTLIKMARAHRAREPLQKAGVGLNLVYPLLMENRTMELETLLAKDIPLQLLANDTMGITAGMLGELQRKAAEVADPDQGSARYLLFLGYLLFSGQTDDALAAVLIERAAGQASDRNRQEALVVLGRLHERQGRLNRAVDAYLAAVEAGLSMTDVAHHLARIYHMSIAGVLPPKTAPIVTLEQSEPMRIDITTRLSPAPGPDLRSLAETIDVPVNAGQGTRNAF